MTQLLSSAKVSPMMQQWHACKKQAGEAVLFFRMGDFYEAFYEDAQLLAQELDLTLTKRQGIPMSGVPVQTVISYIDRLVAKGVKVAVAEQIGDPKKSKGLVKREIVRFVTPGTVLNSGLLSEKSNNFFCSVLQIGKTFGLSFLDLSTGEFRLTEYEQVEELFNELHRLRPSELLLPEKFKKSFSLFLEEIRLQWKCTFSVLEDWRFDYEMAHDFLRRQFRVHSAESFGIGDKVAAVTAAGSLGLYITETLSLSLEHVQSLSLLSSLTFMQLDRMTQKNLELIESLQDRSKQGTLLQVLDETHTPMGGRLLQQWVTRPLLDLDKIHARQDAVEELQNKEELLGAVEEGLSSVRDLERLMMRVQTGYANPRDILGLALSLNEVQKLFSLKESLQTPLLMELFSNLQDCQPLIDKVLSSLTEDPPIKIGEGGIFQKGYSQELDELWGIRSHSKEWLASYQAGLKESTGIKTLRVGYTKVFGYYIEVSRGQADKMPESFQRRQTLTNSERFITEELQEYEDKVLHAQDRIHALEHKLFLELRDLVGSFSEKVLTTARAVARIDVLSSFARTALQRGYIRPLVDESLCLEIEEGRHPVVENLSQERFVANDTKLDEKERLLVITGPNMAGKSTFIRQVALLSLMAQMGSCIPAKRARIGVVDKIFTRIGASDNLARGQSTFMVEMQETATILHHASDRSLVILDEIGRGTSTYDGISIAWSVAEYLLLAEGKKARTLFATHYWELTQLEGKIPAAVNYNVAVRECADQIIFLRKIVRGGTDKSYGIHVAQLAGLPPSVITRARELLLSLEEQHEQKGKEECINKKLKTKESKQLNLFN